MIPNNDIGNVPASYDKERQARIDETARMLFASTWKDALRIIGDGGDVIGINSRHGIAAYDAAEMLEAERERRIKGMK